MSDEKNEVRQRRIGIANLVLDTISPGVLLYQGTRELRMCWDARKQPPRHDFPARLRTDGNWPQYGYRQRSSGGTAFQALAQLIRYVRDQSRLPICTWEYWSSDTVKLASNRTVELLRDGGYGDPKKTCCVLCGASPITDGLDWWSLDGVVGPSCGLGRCKASS